VREVVVDGRLRDRRLTSDVVERRTTDATLTPELVGRLKHALACRATGFPPVCWHLSTDSTYRSVDRVENDAIGARLWRRLLRLCNDNRTCSSHGRERPQLLL